MAFSTTSARASTAVRHPAHRQGREVRDIVETHQKHATERGGINSEEFATLNKSLHWPEGF
jgi:hypothetical protein